MIKVGIFFGGQSREREISFAGGRTVYDNLNKQVFEPVPVFVDSLGNFILLDWQYIYKGTIRDFYPPLNTEGVPASFRMGSAYQIYIESLANLNHEQAELLINRVGRKLQPEEFKNLFDFAFLCLHGPYGEDGNIQGLLDWYGIPYSGAGILSSAIGIDKSVQRKFMLQAGFKRPKSYSISKQAWQSHKDKAQLMKTVAVDLGMPFIIKAPQQGSSIGVSKFSKSDASAFIEQVNRSFFVEEIQGYTWQNLSSDEKVNFIRKLTDIRDGIGLPVQVLGGPEKGTTIYTPDALFALLETLEKNQWISLEPLNSEEEVLFESFISGREFSCIVVQSENGAVLALPPTEIIKGAEVYDYRSKYLPGMSRKLTPIDLPEGKIQAIREECVRLFTALQFNVYARIDGFITDSGEIFLNDPNTTSGMLPSSFFFHQAAEIGLNPSQFLSFIIRTSLQQRLHGGKNNQHVRDLIAALDQDLKQLQEPDHGRLKVAVVMGGYSSERHISVESGRNIYEKLSSSSKYEPIPVFLTGDNDDHQLYKIPVSVMLKDNADDIKAKVEIRYKLHPILEQIRSEAEFITTKYAGETSYKPEKLTYKQLADQIDACFIALHGRPGEDGAIQAWLEKYGVPYNGSGIQSSSTTINKYQTNEILKQNGISVAEHDLVTEVEYKSGAYISKVEDKFTYPLIAKPVDDGCSSAVKKIKNREELVAFANLIFRSQEELTETDAHTLHLKLHEEFPQKQVFLVETLVERNGAKHFLEITGGLLTRYNDKGEVFYEVFEASEALASGEVLSLEEKFLAGEGQNITPARYSPEGNERQRISNEVKKTLEKTARVLNVEGYARIDAFVRVYENGEVETIIIEVNSLPGMTPATCIFHQTAINNLKPYDFIDQILDFGFERKRKALGISI